MVLQGTPERKRVKEAVQRDRRVRVVGVCVGSGEDNSEKWRKVALLFALRTMTVPFLYHSNWDYAYGWKEDLDWEARTGMEKQA
jgi:hypothetical protein